VIWAPEFAAAGWILDLDRFRPRIDDFFPATLTANRWNGALFALPWFVDVGMLYWRTDVMARAPTDLVELRQLAARGTREHAIPFGFVWQGARYEGLVTVFLELLGAFGGTILDDHGRVVVDSDRAVDALTWMRDSIDVDRIVPASALTWQEEQVRLAFQNGQAVFMRNWPYAHALLQDPSQSRVAGRFGIAPMPATSGGSPTAALGGSVLAINANSGDSDAAYQLIEYLLEPAQLLTRARIVGQYPPRPTMYETKELEDALRIAPSDARRIIEHAVPRRRTGHVPTGGRVVDRERRALGRRADGVDRRIAERDSRIQPVLDAVEHRIHELDGRDLLRPDLPGQRNGVRRDHPAQV